jgi:hypothetical protein
MTMTSGAGSIALKRFSSAMPSMSGSSRSSSTTSGRHDWYSSSARARCRPARTSYPGAPGNCSMTIFSQSVVIGSSSTTSTRRRRLAACDT